MHDVRVKEKFHQVTRFSDVKIRKEEEEEEN